jgi:hypothetical protein
MITNEKLETSFLPLRDPRSARRRRADVTTRETIVVGGRVPADIELESAPTDWGPSLTKYRYVYSGDRVMLVDPGSRTVVQEVD